MNDRNRDDLWAPDVRHRSRTLAERGDLWVVSVHTGEYSDFHYSILGVADDLDGCIAIAENAPRPEWYGSRLTFRLNRVAFDAARASGAEIVYFGADRPVDVPDPTTIDPNVYGSESWNADYPIYVAERVPHYRASSKS